MMMMMMIIVAPPRLNFEDVLNVKTHNLLFAAGENFMMFNGSIRSFQWGSVSLIGLSPPDRTLTNLSREIIRKYLLKVDRHWNLFHRIPKLGLPSPLIKYLLYDQSLDDDDDSSSVNDRGSLYDDDNDDTYENDNFNSCDDVDDGSDNEHDDDIGDNDASDDGDNDDDDDSGDNDAWDEGDNGRDTNDDDA